VIGEMVELLRPACERIEVAGSVRRGKLEVKDAEVVIIPTPDLLPLTETLIEYGTAQYALYGEKLTKRWGNSYRGLMFKGIKCELFMTTADAWGYQYWLRTGPGDANTFIMRWLAYKKAPVRFQDGYGWYSANWQLIPKGKEQKWHAADRQRLRIASEEDLFAVLGMPFIPPAERTEMVYKKLLGNRAHKWPETYAPYFATDAAQMDLITRAKVTHFFDADSGSEKEQEAAARIAAEREYTQRLMSVPVEELKSGEKWSMDQWWPRV
jgi:hypothetical protein